MSDSNDSVKTREENRGASFEDYLPLIVIVVLAMAAGTAREAGTSGWELRMWMHDFMGIFLVIFSMFKFFNLEGFAEGVPDV